jgi:hypothetical protein
MVTLLDVVTPPILIWIGTAPLGVTPLGTWTLIWLRATNWGDRPERAGGWWQDAGVTTFRPMYPPRGFAALKEVREACGFVDGTGPENDDAIRFGSEPGERIPSEFRDSLFEGRLSAIKIRSDECHVSI